MSSADPFESILKSMGVEKYDPMVLSALNEYARRIAGDILCDARDYANHRAAVDIDASDIKVALQLSRSFKTRTVPEGAALKEAMDAVNKTPLAMLIDDKSYVIRYPKSSDYFVEGPDPVSGLLQRTYTLLPPATKTQSLERMNSGSGEVFSNDSDHPPIDGESQIAYESGAPFAQMTLASSESQASILTAPVAQAFR